ncbi:MAG: ribonuclease PH [Planctomycetes bacterium]|nr:ribonuclease PH [Planctomycetota bacterium]MBI3833627.1 ribonuclease PH [Planctomycetota bacterium]
MIKRTNRSADALRPVTIRRGYTRSPHGSVLIQAGNTIVLCTACWAREVPPWKKGQGTGWVTAEYDMLPAATHERRARNRTKIDGRTQEIQRLIGRSLRAVVDLAALGENSILIDCDVLQADGGTRTASITGAYVALCDAVAAARKNRWIEKSPITDAVAAVSVGIVDGRARLDLDYAEDSAAEVDMNVVMTGSGKFVEVQGSGEEATFTKSQMDRMVLLAQRGIRKLLTMQMQSLKRKNP